MPSKNCLILKSRKARFGVIHAGFKNNVEQSEVSPSVIISSTSEFQKFSEAHL